MIHCVGGDQDHWPLEIRTAGAFGLTGVENQEHVHGGVSGIVTKDQLGRPRPQRFAEFRHIHAGRAVPAELDAYLQGGDLLILNICWGLHRRSS